MDVALKIRTCVDADLIPYDKEAFKTAFLEYQAIIAVMACGIAVREVGPLLEDKWTDPAVVVTDAGLNYAVALCGGHHGANELAQRLAGTGACPVITTATEVMGRPCVEGIAQALDCEIVNKESTRAINTCLLNSDLPVIEIHGPKVVIINSNVSVLKKKTGPHHKSGVIVGIGTRRAISSSSVINAVYQALHECGLELTDVELFASADIKQHESGLIKAIAEMKGEIVFVPAEVINSIETPSESAALGLGLIGVSEPAALALSSENELIMKKRVYDNVTIAIAR